ncbi:hypothetical protein CSC94_22800 [Zhengella mangrovi]|uniref:RND transporter n=1 Tax=Zhengella mangrovi TaxID=1982044 RepID=A0A2G1QGX2_9HYPH|nr:copper-binding protein [Zhengella mangrovi]PHP64763.1 hypothetical protein CSC94_22800 [Zhengella mangrovi]
MNHLVTASLAFALGLASISSAFATDYTRGTVRKVDMKTGKVTIAHEELKNLDMPAMTMVFRMASDAMLDGIKEGQDIEFVADRVNGRLTVTEIRQ